MNRPRIRGTGAIALLLLILVLPACSKKAVEEPPATTPPPAEAPQSTPPPATPPEEPSTPPAEPTAPQWQDVYFDYDSYSLNPDGRAALDGDARLLRDNAGAQVTIEGHCDERGTTEYNLALGERRAAAARDYLVAAGVDGGRIDIISFGEERPFATGSDEASWAQNRRAHFVAR
jgi:peptidoglycan-associated lipoprotein